MNIMVFLVLVTLFATALLGLIWVLSVGMTVHAVSEKLNRGFDFGDPDEPIRKGWAAYGRLCFCSILWLALLASLVSIFSLGSFGNNSSFQHLVHPAHHIHSNRPPEPLKVIGATLSRTGTSSLTMALTTLGYKVYHGENAMDAPDHALWAQLAEADEAGDSAATALAVQGVIDEIAAQGWSATCDKPAGLLYSEFLDAYPTAKVILTVRSVDGWGRSMLSTVVGFNALFGQPPLNWFENFRDVFTVTHWMWRRIGIEHLHSHFPLGIPEYNETTFDEDAIRLGSLYANYIEEVKARVPPSQLLVFSAGDGWDALCDFLDVEHCPDDNPYPKKNDKLQMQRILQVLELWKDHHVALLLVLLSAFLVTSVQLYKKGHAAFGTWQSSEKKEQ